METKSTERRFSITINKATERKLRVLSLVWDCEKDSVIEKLIQDYKVTTDVFNESFQIVE